jgi:hypothetical protein
MEDGMKTYRVTFHATVERDVEVPAGLNWSEAYEFVRDQLGWHEVAHSPAAVVTIDTSRTTGFNTPQYIAYWRARSAPTPER